MTSLYLFGSSTAIPSTDGFALAVSDTSVSAMFGSDNTVIAKNVSYDVRHFISMSSRGVFLDDEYIIDDSNSSTEMYGSMSFSTPFYLCIGGINLSNNVGEDMFVGSIYYIRIYQSNSIVRELIPANMEGEVGMFDVVTSTFYRQIGG